MICAKMQTLIVAVEDRKLTQPQLHWVCGTHLSMRKICQERNFHKTVQTWVNIEEDEFCDCREGNGGFG